MVTNPAHLVGLMYKRKLMRCIPISSGNPNRRNKGRSIVDGACVLGSSQISDPNASQADFTSFVSISDPLAERHREINNATALDRLSGPEAPEELS
jgi:hypothetical protein